MIRSIVFLLAFGLMSVFGLADLYVDQHTTGCGPFPDHTYNEQTRSCGDGDKTVYDDANAAAGALAPGETLFLRQGTYGPLVNGSGTWGNNLPSGTSWENATRIKVYPGEDVRIERGDGWTVVNFQSLQYVILDGSGSGIIDGLSAEGSGSGIGCNSSTHIRIEGWEIRNAPHNGVAPTNPACTDWQIVENYIHHNGFGSTTSKPHGVYVGAARALVERNIVAFNKGSGIHQFNSNEGADEAIIRYNIVFGNGAADGTQAEIVSGSGKDIRVYSNIVYNGEVGISIGYNYGNEGNNGVVANTIVNCITGIVVHTSAGANPYLRNNLIWGPQTLVPINDLRADTILEGNFLPSDGDPLFVDVANADFRLQEGSPAIDFGVSIPWLTEDFDGVSRPQGLTYDVGAFEYFEQDPTSQEIVELQEAVAILQDQVAALQSEVSTLQSDLQAVDGRSIENEAVIEAIKAALSALLTEIQ